MLIDARAQLSSAGRSRAPRSIQVVTSPAKLSIPVHASAGARPPAAAYRDVKPPPHLHDEKILYRVRRIVGLYEAKAVPMDNPLRILKRRLPVTLWVHPEGRVVGNIFLHLRGDELRESEATESVLNEPAEFLVVERRHPDETRFYNKQAIVRVDYV